MKNEFSDVTQNNLVSYIMLVSFKYSC